MENIQKFLVICKKYKHHLIPVLFDDCWNSQYHSGKQPDPVPGIHNSQWVQCPGAVAVQDSVLQSYVTVILNKFKNEEAIAFWDLYN